MEYFFHQILKKSKESIYLIKLILENKKSNKLSKTRKQKVYVMRGCSKKTKSCKNNTKKINNQNSPTTIASYVDSINNSKMSLNSTRTSKSSTEIDYNSYYSKTFDDDQQQQQRHSPSDDYLVTSGDIERFNKLKSEDLNIENDKWLEDKPISVLHLDQPDRAVLKIAGLF
jgi:hypothetical protein